MNRNRRAGFSLVEMLIALTLGVIVVSAAIKYFMTEFRVLTANDVREVVARNGRYIGVALRRDLLQRHDIEVGAGLGALAGHVWRSGLMGENARPASVDRLATALEAELGA